MMRAALLFLLAVMIGLLPVTDRMVLAQQSGQPVAPQAAPQATPTQVPVRGGLHEGYGRLVFDWPGSVDYTAAVEDGSLVIQFDRPLRADLSGALANLRSFLAGGSLEPDGRTLSFVLANGDFGLRSFKIGTSVVLDLLRQGGAETASAPPPPSPLPASPDIPSLQVRGADHEGYSRLVFDWNQPVDYTVDNRNGQATLRFDRPASFETGTLNSRPLRNVRRVEPTGNDSRGMTLQIPSDARLRHFRSGTRIVVDVLNPASEAPAGAQQAAPQQAAAPTPAPKPPAGERSQSQAPAQPPQQQAQAPAQPSAQPSGQPPARPRPAGTAGRAGYRRTDGRGRPGHRCGAAIRAAIRRQDHADATAGVLAVAAAHPRAGAAGAVAGHAGAGDLAPRG